ncbi:hypothetical protein [Neisseria flavescens]|uniref:hypothetical protein n=1 Tax=Neisseria flavescens TaxID=484 RepID=UPI001E3D4D4B|nr:hypothetical protein [Neisseria flavescens]
MKELLSNFLKAQEEKIKIPTFITFLIALLVSKIWIYWKPISIFLLSTKAIECRIKAIDREISFIENNLSISPFWLSFLFALAITISYTILFPFIQLGVNAILSWVKKKNFNIKADIETEIRKRKIEIEKVERKVRDLQNKNAIDRSLNDQLRDKDDQINNLLEEMSRISNNNKNQINNIKEIHSNEVGNIHAVYESEIENLNNVIAELEDKISVIQNQAQSDYNNMREKHDEQLYRVQQEANSENDRLFNENKKLRSEIEQLKSKNSS